MMAIAACNAAAQQNPPARWSIEINGGAAVSTAPGTGTVTFPLPGAPLVTSNPIFPTWQVPSWFFGDGAAMLNNAVADYGLTARLTPLDASISGRAFSPGLSGVIGGRLRRAISGRLALEGSIDLIVGSSNAGHLAGNAGTTTDSFKALFNALFASGPFVNTAVDASVAVTGRSNRELTATGAINWSIGHRSRFTPYMTGGGGIITSAGGTSSVTLDGHYRTTIRAGVPAIDVPIEEFDHVTVRSKERLNWIAVGGAGLARSLGQRLTLRLDVRVLIGPNSRDVVISATPSSTRGTPANFIEILSYPAIQFSNDPATGRQSTLSGPGVRNVTIFEGTGIQTRTLVTIGISRRF